MHNTMKGQPLFVLVACEESQAECKAFRSLGHIAFSCDLQKCRPSGEPSWHICSDVSPLLQGQTHFRTQNGQEIDVPGWDIIIAHPPCTYLCKVGSIHLYKNPDYEIFVNGQAVQVNAYRYAQMLIARDFFFRCLNASAKYVAVENPCPMALAQLPKADSFACPSWFGYKYTKKTYYWLKNLPPIFAELINPNTKSLVHCTRGKYRSRTFQGLADALALQWSEYVQLDRQQNSLDYGKNETNFCTVGNGQPKGNRHDLPNAAISKPLESDKLPTFGNAKLLLR